MGMRWAAQGVCLAVEIRVSHERYTQKEDVMNSDPRHCAVAAAGPPQTHSLNSSTRRG